MFSDLRYSLRRLRKSMGVTAAIVLTLGLCIGANSLVFSMLYGLVLQPLPFPDSDQLVEILNTYPKSGQMNVRGNVSQYLDYAKHPDLFSDVAVYHFNSGSAGGNSGTTQVGNAMVTPSFFSLLRVKPVVGRFFTAEEAIPANSQSIVLTESYWKAHYGSNPDIVGQKILFGEAYYTVVGVAPKAVEALTPNLGILTPISWEMKWFDDMSRHSRDFNTAGRLFARLQPGISLPQAAPRITAIDRSFYDKASAEYQRFCDRTGYRTAVNYLHENQVGAKKSILFLLQAAALLVLLIGCVNVANLMLARAAARESELALRHALGASHWALVRQLLLESLILTLAGGALGIGLSTGGVKAVTRFGAALLPYGYQLHLQPEVLAFTLGIMALVGAFIGLVPIFFSARGSLFQNLQQISRHASQSRRRRLVGALLVSGQVALSVVLLIGAGLLIRSLVKVAAVDPGFKVAQITTARVVVPDSVLQNSNNVASLQSRIIASLQKIPRVDAVALATDTPLGDLYRALPLFFQGPVDGLGGTNPMVSFSGVSPDYFKTLGIPVLRGRAFDERDNAAQANSVIIDRSIAEKYFPGLDPVGRKIAFGRVPQQESQWDTIVGVVGMTEYVSLDSSVRTPFAYVPIQKFPWAGNSYFVRSDRSSEDLLPLVREQVLAANPTLQPRVNSLRAIVTGTLSTRKAILILLGSFAGIALLLACIGIYSVLAYDVSQRTREIGIRGAVGASRGQILTLILRQGLWETGLGLAVGLAGALLLGRLIQSLLFGVEASDPVTLATITFVLLAVGFVASLLPAWRAARIDPIVALHCE